LKDENMSSEGRQWRYMLEREVSNIKRAPVQYKD
jgi:hypothetical protein